MSKNKEEYKRFIRKREDIPVFFQDWWLDVVTGDKSWDIILVKGKEDQIQLALPYVISTRLGLKIISQPPLTSFLGAKIFYPPQKLKEAKRNSFEKEILDRLSVEIHRIGVVYFNQLFSPDFTNWKPLFWNNFQQTTYYRFVLNGIKNKEQTMAGFKHNKKYEINKFSKSSNTIIETEDAGLMYDLILSSYKKDNSRIPFSKALYLQLDDALKTNGHRKIFKAIDERGSLIAALMVVIDHDRAYLLSTGMNYEVKDSTVKTALIWHSINYASEFVDTYDFCGSMIKPISDFFQGFGGELQAYSRIFKHRNKLVKTIFTILGK